MIAMLSLLLATNTSWAGYVALPALQYDCIGEVCLNATAPGQIADKVVHVMNGTWERKVQVCSGVVTAITIDTYWLSPLAWAAISEDQRIAPFNRDTADGKVSTMISADLINQALQVGWVQAGTKVLTNPVGVAFSLLNPNVNGVRAVVNTIVDDGLGHVVMMVSTHPDQSRLCGSTPGH